MRYMIWIGIIFVSISILYALYNSFKNYLLKKYNYEFYDDSIISTLCFSLVLVGVSLVLNYIETPHLIFEIMLAVAIIIFLLVLINNIANTSFLSGILVTILQAIFAVYIMVMFSIIINQLRDIFLSSNKEK